MKYKLDLTGQRFGQLVVQRKIKYEKNTTWWECLCECGKYKTIKRTQLVAGSTKSCGCFRPKGENNPYWKHGRTDTLMFHVWKMMRQRCSDKNNKSYKNYGGRGIKVCERWDKSFKAFIDDVGERPTAQHSIDRIDNSKGYEPGNVRWATRKEQARNKRDTRWITAFGQTLSLIEQCEKYGMKQQTVWLRLHLGWSAEDALTRPIRKVNRPDRMAPTQAEANAGTWIDRTEAAK